MKTQTSVLNGIYSAFMLNKGFVSKRPCEMFPPRVSENLEKELLEEDFYVSYIFLYDYCL